MPYADGPYLVLDDGRRFGPFSSHWAACAAMIRTADPTFRSTGGDRPDDIAIEATIADDQSPSQLSPQGARHG